MISAEYSHYKHDIYIYRGRERERAKYEKYFKRKMEQICKGYFDEAL